MQWTHKVAVIVGTFFLASTYAIGVQAATGVCIKEPGFSQVWELKTLSCVSPDCQIEMDRVAFSPIPSSGAARLDADLWRFTWTGNFAGSTQGTLQYACEITPKGPLPFTGTGMVQRIANFSPGKLPEYFTGKCELDLCTSLSPASELHPDEATQR